MCGCVTQTHVLRVSRVALFHFSELINRCGNITRVHLVFSIIGSVAEHLACNQKHAGGLCPANCCSRQQSRPTCGQSAGSRGDRGAGQWQNHMRWITSRSPSSFFFRFLAAKHMFKTAKTDLIAAKHFLLYFFGRRHMPPWLSGRAFGL